ncbi:MAG: NAD-dependent epimerase/dehydratase [Chloroflexi bacterium OLB14]|nr:MAG: NAD-dependent epimerase/dehydratase [Chloroflexi bacterium OLB14]
MKIAVTGAFSYSGKYITRRLLAQGHEVVTLTNHPERSSIFDNKVKAYPLNFNEAETTKALEGVDTFYNTYWVRFDRGTNTQPAAVENTRRLISSAKKAGVKRVVHISIANPDINSHLPYYWGKAENEKTVIESGMSYAILRPTVLFGIEDILINNIAYLVRRFPFFLQMGDGKYKIQPVYIEDLADLAVEAASRNDNLIWDAVGTDIFTFDELVKTIGKTVNKNPMIIHTHPRIALTAAQFLSLFVRDVLLTPEEVDGLMANLLVSSEPARCKTSLRKWLEENKDTVGTKYASELKKHYLKPAFVS